MHSSIGYGMVYSKFMIYYVLFTSTYEYSKYLYEKLEICILIIYANLAQHRLESLLTFLVLVTQHFQIRVLSRRCVYVTEIKKRFENL